MASIGIWGALQVRKWMVIICGAISSTGFGGFFLFQTVVTLIRQDWDNVTVLISSTPFLINFACGVVFVIYGMFLFDDNKELAEKVDTTSQLYEPLVTKESLEN
jgi:hypothetical protein